jgi:hypothetical protein
MLLQDDRNIVDFKLSLLTDLEKKIKMGYKSQFRNIVIKIVSKPKRYKKIKAPVNVIEDVNKLDTMSRSLYNYLIDMFDVFGDSAILNAKRIFEDNGAKWGKKFNKSLASQHDSTDMKKLVKELYISIKDLDYLTIANRQLLWVFKKPEDDSPQSQNADRYFNSLYEVKSLWLQSFIRALKPECSSVFETIEGEPGLINTNIIIKEGA